MPNDEPTYLVAMKLDVKYYATATSQADQRGGARVCCTKEEADQFASEMNAHPAWRDLPAVEWWVERPMGRRTVVEVPDMDRALVRGYGHLGLMEVNLYEQIGPGAFERCEQWVLENPA